MTFEYIKLRNTVFDDLNYYDPVKRTYPFEERGIQLAQDCYDQSDNLLRNAQVIIDTVLTECNPPRSDILKLSIAIDMLTKAANALRMADEVDPLRDLIEIEKEPLECNQESSRR